MQIEPPDVDQDSSSKDTYMIENFNAKIYKFLSIKSTIMVFKKENSD